MQRLIFIPILLLAMTADAWFNGFRTISLYPEMAVGIVLIAICLAFSAPLFDYYANGDKMVTRIAVMVACASLAMSMLSGYGSIVASKINHESGFDQRQAWEKELATELTDEKIDACRKDAYCVSQEKRDRREYIREQLETGNYSSIPTNDKSKEFLGWALLAGLALLPFISLASARILANLELKTVPKPVESGSSGSKPRNQAEPKKKEVGSKSGEIVVTGTGKGRKKRIPTAEQKLKLIACYEVMKRKGEKISQCKLAKEAGVSKEATAWWLKNATMPNVKELYK